VINHYRKNSFSLIEVLVALTVIAVCFSVYMRALNLNIKNTNVSKSYITANLLAKKKLAKLVTNNDISKESDKSEADKDQKNKIEEGKKHGNFGYNFPGFKWKSDIKKQSKYLYSIKLSVSFVRLGETRTLVFNTLVINKAALKNKTSDKKNSSDEGKVLKNQ
jgi:prepilin-type N-terminal cleavage/methylation domain-containing protein